MEVPARRICLLPGDDERAAFDQMLGLARVVSPTGKTTSSTASTGSVPGSGQRVRVDGDRGIVTIVG
jgi:hypothetical protein